MNDQCRCLSRRVDISFLVSTIAWQFSLTVPPFMSKQPKASSGNYRFGWVCFGLTGVIVEFVPKPTLVRVHKRLFLFATRAALFCRRRAVCNVVFSHLAITRSDPPRVARSSNERSTRDQPGL